MAEIRSLTDDELNEAARMADAVFRKEGQTSMKRAYPFIFSAAAASCSFGAFTNDGSLVSFMGLVPWDIRIGEATVHACSLGSVFTLPEARGQGLASDILQHIYRYMRQMEAPLLFVSGIKSLYARTGCVPFGRMFRFSLHGDAAEAVRGRANRPDAAWSIREARADDLYRMHELAAGRQARYEISVRELGALIKAEGFASNKRQTHRVLLAERNGRTEAFLVVGASDIEDRPGLVIEYAGDPQAILRLAAESVLSCRLSSLDFAVPWHECELADSLRSAGVPASEINHSGAIRIVDGQALIRQMQPWLQARMPQSTAQTLQLTETGNGEWLYTRGEVSRTLSAQETVREIFDYADGDTKPPAAAREALPVPLPHTVGLCYI